MKCIILHMRYKKNSKTFDFYKAEIYILPPSSSSPPPSSPPPPPPLVPFFLQWHAFFLQKFSILWSLLTEILTKVNDILFQKSKNHLILFLTNSITNIMYVFYLLMFNSINTNQEVIITNRCQWRVRGWYGIVCWMGSCYIQTYGTALLWLEPDEKNRVPEFQKSQFNTLSHDLLSLWHLGMIISSKRRPEMYTCVKNMSWSGVEI